MTYMLFALSLLLVGGVALVVVQAFRSEHLLAFRHRTGEFFLFERGLDGRYQIIPPVHAPLAVWRFARARAQAVLGSAPEAVLRHVPGLPLRALHRT